ncbi:protein of unknown function [Shewanella benthica]|uniref:Uncharacterized protein n=1 Tax=Shewanella benthica TaxID=43661 RepID=A0A330M3V8_9GAMM|nr:protein of unknown function [Shewanella benthica]
MTAGGYSSADLGEILCKQSGSWPRKSYTQDISKTVQGHS